MRVRTQVAGDGTPAPGDEGIALLGVLGTMTLVTVLLLATLGQALRNSAPARADQDSKAATAAAQAGIEEYVSRLNADDTYYAVNGTGVDTTNPAFTPPGVSVQGSGGAAATYSYSLLTTPEQTALSGLIRLKVTGRSKGVSRSLTASLRPDGFLKYLYLTDLEAGDPALYNAGLRVRHNGDLTRNVLFESGATKSIDYHWLATPGMVDGVCSSYYYTARHARTYTTGQYIEVAQPRKSNGEANGPPTTTVRTADATNRITLDCLEIAFAAGDTVDGPLHSNDALQIKGAATFTKQTTSSWGTNLATSPWGSALAAPTDGKLWWGDKSITLPSRSPVTAPLLQLPTSNEVLQRKANPLTPDSGPGCLYTGQTTITFVNDKMKVLSPGTTSSVSRCYDTSQRNTEQTLSIPPVIYVRSGPCGSVGVGYPRSGEDTRSHRWTTTYDCSYGTAFVSGVLSGRVTIGTSHDVVVVGDTTYKDGMTGSDALGLIPQGSAWVYHPVQTNNENLLSSAATVRKIDAALLSVGHSFLAQNYNVGAALSSSSDPESRLRVRGAIVQKFRGPVGSTTLGTGYLKNYQYDGRLLNAPPPFFLRPLTSPWKVVKVTA